MDQISIIITSLASLIGGLLSVMLAYLLQKRFKTSYNRSFFYHQILIFLFGLYGLIGTYVVHFLMIKFQVAEDTIRFVSTFAPFLGVPFLLTAWYMFIKISYDIIHRQVSMRFTIWFFIVFVIFFLTVGALMPVIKVFNSQDLSIFNYNILFIIIGVEFFTLIIVCNNLYIRSKDMAAKGRKAVFGLAHVLLGIFVISIAILVLILKNENWTPVFIIFYFFKDIAPIAFLWFMINRGDLIVADSESSEDMQVLFDKYGISNREKEIIEHICQGYTNKETAERLFITLQTVKDHTHRIYLKVGVRNRVELTNLFGKSEK